MNQSDSKPRRQWAVTAIALTAISLLLGPSFVPVISAQGGGGGQAVGSRFRVLRSMSGSSGTESNGRLIINDPRTTFYLGKDNKVIVYFEWEGPPGLHKFEGNWKNPEHRVVLVSDFQYVASGKQFSGYWSMLLSGSEVAGLWTLEARIDGESAGEVSFELTSDPNASPPPPPAPPPRQPLPTPELYKRLSDVSVYIDKIDSHGKAAVRGSGFYLDDGRLITAFENIDGAAKLRVILPSGAVQEVSSVRAWNRWQDWAVLVTSGDQVKGIPRAAAKSWAVGTACFFLEAASGSGRIIADGTIVGQNAYPRSGQRLNFVSVPSRATVGSPLVNEFGDVVGMVSGNLLPGADSAGTVMFPPSADNPTQPNYSRDGLAVPIDLIPAAAPDEQTTTLEELARKGQMVPLIDSEHQIIFAGLALTMEKGQGGRPSPSNSRQVFSRQDQKIWVYVSWNENLKFKGTATMAVYNTENRAVAVSNPQKLNLHSGSLAMTTWDIPLATLPTGIYRVDVSQGDDIVWRRYFRLTD